jgi:MoxR-like ATPase
VARSISKSKSRKGPVADVETVARFRDDFFKQVAEVIRGNQSTLESLLVSILAGGHVLLIGPPGLGKTLLVKATSRLLGLDFHRIQFTPDLMPADITGSEIMDPAKGTFRFVEGPVFANIVLADEINRTPPRTQAALLQAMEERQVNVGRKEYPLDNPFFVLATQNPIEQEGTYPLPEAQLDRFLFSIELDYPEYEDEVAIATMRSHSKVDNLKPVVDPKSILAFQQLVPEFPMGESLVKCCVDLVRRSRNDEQVRFGAGPRASQALVTAARAAALLQGDSIVAKSHIRQIAVQVLQHRLVLEWDALSSGLAPAALVQEWVDEIL